MQRYTHEIESDEGYQTIIDIRWSQHISCISLLFCKEKK